MSARTKARKRAADILFEADQRQTSASDVLQRQEADAVVPMNPWVREIVTGYIDHAQTIDEVISTYAEGWPLERMPAVDRALARIGVYELLYADSVDDAVTINEIVNLAGDLSTEESPAFLNGFLGRVSSIRHRLTLD